jgi:hypothetical protein
MSQLFLQISRKYKSIFYQDKMEQLAHKYIKPRLNPGKVSVHRMARLSYQYLYIHVGGQIILVLIPILLLGVTVALPRESIFRD